MADRTSAEIFSNIFIECAKVNDKTAKQIAEKMWLLTRNYDFSTYQMDVSDELRKLGINPDEDGE